MPICDARWKLERSVGIVDLEIYITAFGSKEPWDTLMNAVIIRDGLRQALEGLEEPVPDAVMPVASAVSESGYTEFEFKARLGGVTVRSVFALKREDPPRLPTEEDLLLLQKLARSVWAALESLRSQLDQNQRQRELRPTQKGGA